MPAPTTPKTPTHGQFPLGIDSSTTSPSYYMYDTSPGRGSVHSRKSSLNSPTTARIQQTPERRLSLSVNGSARSAGGRARGASAGGLGFGGAGGNGLGSLADELADAWDEDGEGNESMDNSRLETQYEGCALSRGDEQLGQHDGRLMEQACLEDGDDSSPTRRRRRTYTNDSAHHVNRPPRSKPRKQPGQRRPSDTDDDAGGRHDIHDSARSEPNDIPPSLEARLANIERLAQHGAGSFDGGIDDGDDQIVERLLDDLKDLGGQANIEDGTSRLVTTQMNLTSQLTQHTRALHSLAYPLFFSFSPIVTLHPLATEMSSNSADDDDDLISLLDETSSLIPRHDDHPQAAHASRPHQQPPSPSSVLSSLTDLSSLTTDLIQTLNYLSDTVHMSRQTTTMASRTLKSARTIAAEITRDQTMLEHSIDWIERGDWQAKLARRECQAVCKEVLDGFEEFCRGLTERVVNSCANPCSGGGDGDVGGSGSGSGSGDDDGTAVEAEGAAISKAGVVTPSSSSSYSSISAPSMPSSEDTQIGNETDYANERECESWN